MGVKFYCFMNYVWAFVEWALKRGIAESKSIYVCHSAILIMLPSRTLTQCFNVYQFSLIASIYSICDLWLLFSTEWICFEVLCYQPNRIYLIHPHKVRRGNMLWMVFYILKIISWAKWSATVLWVTTAVHVLGAFSLIWGLKWICRVS